MFKYHLITYGCQMNKSDSERIAGLLARLGGKKATGPEEADLVLLNTCSVRQSAENRVFGQIHNLTQLKKTNPRLIVAVTGCLPGRDKDGALRRKMLDVDLFFPIIDLIKLPEMLSAVMPTDIRHPESVSGSYDDKHNASFWSITPHYQNRFSAFIPIQTGCNNYCAYCVVPYARGPERNRPVKDILAEARQLAENDCVYITLLGQVVNNYQAPDPKNFSSQNPFKNHLAALLWELNQINGLKRLHFTAADPRFMTDELIEALTLPKHLNYLHLPMQSGSNKILTRMNRRYTREQYLSLIEKIKKAKPGIALGTDIIVGFPGETKKDFTKTVSLYKQADFDIAFLAKYSPRSGTAAAKITDNVPAPEKERRWRVLQNLMEEIVRRKNQAYAKHDVQTLIETPTSGHSREDKLVELTNTRPDLVGQITTVKIQKAEKWRLIGNPIDT